MSEKQQPLSSISCHIDFGKVNYSGLMSYIRELKEKGGSYAPGMNGQIPKGLRKVPVCKC